MLVIHDLTFLSLQMAARNHLGEIAYVGQKIQEVPQELKPFLDSVIQDQTKVKNHLELSSIKPLKQGPRKAIFLDRDGIINVDHGYVGDVEQVDLMPGIAKLIAQANHKHFDVNVVTNQSGIGRGYYSEEDYRSVMDCILELLVDEHAKLDHVEFAPFHPDAKNPKYHEGRFLRKPRPGMILKQQMQNQYDLQNSILIGDKASDVMAAMVAGIGNVFLFESEQSDEEWMILKHWLSELKKYGLKDEFANIKMSQLGDFSEVRI